MGTWWTDRGSDLACRRAVVAFALALALVAVPALKAEPAGAAGFPLLVNDTADRPDASVGNGVCATSAGRCTLRAAIQEANALLGPDTINVPPGVYELEVPAVNDDTPSTGDHDIADSVTIVGTGAAATIIDGGFPTAEPPGRGARHRPPVRDPPERGQRHVPGADDPRGLLRGVRRRDRELVARACCGSRTSTCSTTSPPRTAAALNNNDPFAYEWPSGLAAARRRRSRAGASRSRAPSSPATRPAAAAPRSTTSATAASRSPTARSSTTRA